MRTGFAGLSTPIFYDYKQPVGTPADVGTSPNPILDSPMGLFLLFDEIWFLSRSLCPQNMRTLPYVKFLDESGALPPLQDIQVPDLSEKISSDAQFSARYDRFQGSFSVYQENVKRVGVHWEAATDNHSRSFKIGSTTRSGNSISLENLFFDFEVVKRLGHGVELITNTFSQRWLDDPNSPVLKARLSEVLVVDDIPNYLTPQGPYNPCVEEARENQYLKAFRKWISETQVPSEAEIKNVKREVEEAIAKAQRELFLKYYDPKTEYKAIGKTLVGFATDLVPGASQVMGALELAEEVKEAADKRRNRWQAFLVSMKARGARLS